MWQRVLAWAVAATVVHTATGGAQPSSTAPPWAAGVSDADQAKATELAAAGDQLVVAHDLAAAVDRYEAALEAWDHPLFRFKLALADIQLERMVDAADALDAAVKYGEAPFTHEQYAQAITYIRLVRGRIGELAATCTYPGLEVTLDSKRWFTCPGQQKRRLLVGDHQLFATAKGYEAQVHTIHIDPASTVQVNLEGLTTEQAYGMRYRFPLWLPWATMGTGLALGVGGALFWFSGNQKYNEYDQQVAVMCAVNGCTQDQLGPLNELRNSAHTRVLVGTVGMVTGLAALLGGVVLYFTNEPVRYRLDVTPTAGGAAASATWRF